MACVQEEIYSLTQGSDTDFAGGCFLLDYYDTELDLTEYKAVCEVPSAHFSKELPINYDDTDKKWYSPINFTAEETLKMPLGITYIIVTVFDENGKQKSLKRINIKVLLKGSQ